MVNENLGMGERMFCSKRMIKKYNMKVRTRCFITKIIRATGEIREVSGPHYNTMDDDGIDLMLELITNSGTGAAEHLDTANSWLSVANADPIVTHILTFNGTDSRGTGTPTKAAPSALNFYEWHDDSITVRTNQNHIEMWRDDPTAMSGSIKVNHIFANEGTKPADENWHWRIELEMYSTDTDFVDDHMQRFLDVIAGDVTIHMDATRTFFRPFTSADSGLGSTGQNPDGAPVVALGPNTITFVTTVVDGDFNGAWDKMEVGTGATYTTGPFVRVRYGGCTTAGSSCGTKVAGEEYEYTYVITLAQGS